MLVIRGRAETIAADRAASDRLLAAAAGGERAVRVWTPHRQVAFGRRDARADGYDRARDRAREAGFPPIERDVGGRAVAYDGETTLAFARAEPVADLRHGIADRYEGVTAAVADALGGLGIPVERGEPPDSFCPGSHSLRVRDGDEAGKVAGIAQRVTDDAAVVAGVLVVVNRAELAAVLESTYDALDVPFEPESVGAIAGTDGADLARIREALEAGLVDGASMRIERP